MRATRGVDDRIERLLAFVSTEFFDRKLSIVHEHSKNVASADATFEPGHSLEWTWLLTWYANGERGHAYDPFAKGLYRRALSVLYPNTGYACMAANVSGARLDPSCRLWSQAEALKAHISIATVADSSRQRQHSIDLATEICRGIRRDWLAISCDGGWRDHLDESGELIAKDMPASTGYHLFGAIEVLQKGLARIEGSTR